MDMMSGKQYMKKIHPLSDKKLVHLKRLSTMQRRTCCLYRKKPLT